MMTTETEDAVIGSITLGEDKFWHFNDGRSLKYREPAFEDGDCVFKVMASDYICHKKKTNFSNKGKWPCLVKLVLNSSLCAKFEIMAEALETQLNDDVDYCIENHVYLDTSHRVNNQLCALTEKYSYENKPALLMTIKVRHIVFNEAGPRVKFILQRVKEVRCSTQDLFEEQAHEEEEEDKKKATRKRKAQTTWAQKKQKKANTEVEPIGIREWLASQENDALETAHAFPAAL